MIVDLKKLLVFLGMLIPVVAGLWAGGTYLVGLVDSKQERRVSYLSLLIEVQTNRITILSMLEDRLTPEQRAELEALRRTRTLNECEHKKAIGLLGADHMCRG